MKANFWPSLHERTDTMWVGDWCYYLDDMYIRSFWKMLIETIKNVTWVKLTWPMKLVSELVWICSGCHILDARTAVSYHFLCVTQAKHGWAVTGSGCTVVLHVARDDVEEEGVVVLLVSNPSTPFCPEKPCSQVPERGTRSLGEVVIKPKQVCFFSFYSMLFKRTQKLLTWLCRDAYWGI